MLNTVKKNVLYCVVCSMCTLKWVWLNRVKNYLLGGDGNGGGLGGGGDWGFIGGRAGEFMIDM